MLPPRKRLLQVTTTYVRSFRQTPPQRRTIAGLSRQIPEQVKLNQVTVQLHSSPSATSSSSLKKEAIKLISKNLRVPNTHDAAVILASKNLTSWLDDDEFISKLLSSTTTASSSSSSRSLKIITAAVDQVPRYDRNGVFAPGEGISIFPVNESSVLLPDSLEKSSNNTKKPSLEFTIASLGFNGPLHVTVPLANTLFQNGKTHVLAASEWTQTQNEEGWSMKQKTEKVTQIINLPPFGTTVLDQQELGSLLSTSLIPLTIPRKIIAGLGNILRLVEGDSTEPTPASKELESIIPLLLKKRKEIPSFQEQSKQGGPIGVWALIIPKEVSSAVSIHDKYVPPINVKSYKSSGEWELAQVTSPYVGRLLSWGCQLRKILSGGGGWGTKQGLLSLDPETTFNSEEGNEDEDLESFIRSFKAEETNSGIVTPGSYVQFFAEGIYPRAYGQRAFHSRSSAYVLGTASEEEEGNQVQQRVGGDGSSWQVHTGLFGAVSCQGIYVETDTPEHLAKTKIDAPGTYVVMVPALPVAIKYEEDYMSVEEAARLKKLEDEERKNRIE